MGGRSEDMANRIAALCVGKVDRYRLVDCFVIDKYLFN